MARLKRKGARKQRGPAHKRKRRVVHRKKKHAKLGYRPNAFLKSKNVRATPFRMNKKAGGRGIGRTQAVPTATAIPDFTDMTFFVEASAIWTDIAGNTHTYFDWSLNNPRDYLNTHSAAAAPGWTQCAALYDIWRWQGSSTAIDVYSIRGPTETTDPGATCRVTLVPHRPTSTYPLGVIDSGSAATWSERERRATSRLMCASVYNTNARVRLSGRYTTEEDMEGNMREASTMDTAYQTGVSSDPSVLASWNFIVSSIDFAAADTYSGRARIRIWHRARFQQRIDSATSLERIAALQRMYSQEANGLTFYKNGNSPWMLRTTIVSPTRPLLFPITCEPVRVLVEQKDPSESDFEEVVVRRPRSAASRPSGPGSFCPSLTPRS